MTPLRTRRDKPAGSGCATSSAARLGRRLHTPPKPFLAPLQKTRVLYQFPRDRNAPRRTRAAGKAGGRASLRARPRQVGGPDARGPLLLLRRPTVPNRHQQHGRLPLAARGQKAPQRAPPVLGIGAFSCALIMAPVLNLLAQAYGIGDPTRPGSLQAPQATRDAGCGTVTIDEAGTKTASGTKGVAGCW